MFSSHLDNAQRPSHQAAPLRINGRGGIRTHGTVSRTPVFKTGSFGRSDTLPNCRNYLSIRTKARNDGPVVPSYRVLMHIGYFGCSYHRDPLSTIETHTVRGSRRGSRWTADHIMPIIIRGQDCRGQDCHRMPTAAQTCPMAWPRRKVGSNLGTALIRLTSKSGRNDWTRHRRCSCHWQIADYVLDCRLCVRIQIMC